VVTAWEWVMETPYSDNRNYLLIVARCRRYRPSGNGSPPGLIETAAAVERNRAEAHWDWQKEFSTDPADRLSGIRTVQDDATERLHETLLE